MIELTPKQEEVLFAIADGLSTEEIAQELNVSPSTVSCHIKDLLNNLGARNRAHAVALAYHHNIFIPKELNGRMS